MSRWSDEFDKHPIHQLLNQADEYLAIEVEDTDAEFEDERRRLKNVLGNLREVAAGLDPEFYPKQWLDQINQHFTGQVLNQLKAYAAKPAIAQLRAANDQATAQAVNIYYIAAMSRPVEAQEAVNQAQQAFWFLCRLLALAERNGREHQSQASKMAPASALHPAMHRSRYEGDLRLLQQHASQMPRMEDASRSVPRKDDGGIAMRPLL